MNKIRSHFWRRVLETWIELNCQEQLKVNIQQPLFNNRLLEFKKKTLFLPSAINQGVKTIQDMYEGDEIITYEQYVTKYGQYIRSWLDYNIIYNSLKKHNKDIRESVRNENTATFRDIPEGNHL